MIEMENINLIKEIMQELIKIKKMIESSGQKRWMNTNELASYLGYSSDRIYKIKKDYLIEGVHYYNKTGKILFDRVAIDDWVVGKETDETHKSTRQVVDHILSSIQKAS